MSRASRVLFGAAVIIHVSMLVSWRTGTLNALFFDATVTHGRRGWDFYALYQAGHNVLTGYSAYESDGLKIDVVIPDGTFTPFRYLPISAYTLGVLLNLVSPLWAYRLWVAAVELTLLLCVALTWRAVRLPQENGGSETAPRQHPRVRPLGQSRGTRGVAQPPQRWSGAKRPGGVVRSTDRRARLVAMWLCYSPFFLELYMGQFSFVQGALVFVVLLSALRGELGLRSDLAWVSSVLWKQNTALFCPLLVRLGRWRALGICLFLLLVTAGPYFLFVPGSLAAFLRNFDSEPPWFQFGNLGFRQLVFDAMWSAGDVLGVQIKDSLYASAQLAVVGLFLCIPLLLTVLDRRLALARSQIPRPPRFARGPWASPQRREAVRLPVRTSGRCAHTLPAGHRDDVSGTPSRYGVSDDGTRRGVGAAKRERPRPDLVSHLCLWMSTYFMIYHHVWEHHYVMILPVLVVLSMRNESVWLWVVYVLLALPTPFYLIDPRGQVAVLDAMRWTPIRPLWQDLLYHASKAVPVLVLYCSLAWRIARSVLQDWREGLCLRATA